MEWNKLLCEKDDTLARRIWEKYVTVFQDFINIIQSVPGRVYRENYDLDVESEVKKIFEQFEITNESILHFLKTNISNSPEEFISQEIEALQTRIKHVIKKIPKEYFETNLSQYTKIFSICVNCFEYVLIIGCSVYHDTYLHVIKNYTNLTIFDFIFRAILVPFLLNLQNNPIFHYRLYSFVDHWTKEILKMFLGRIFDNKVGQCIWVIMYFTMWNFLIRIVEDFDYISIQMYTFIKTDILSEYGYDIYTYYGERIAFKISDVSSIIENFITFMSKKTLEQMGKDIKNFFESFIRKAATRDCDPGDALCIQAEEQDTELSKLQKTSQTIVTLNELINIAKENMVYIDKGVQNRKLISQDKPDYQSDQTEKDKEWISFENRLNENIEKIGMINVYKELQKSSFIGTYTPSPVVDPSNFILLLVAMIILSYIGSIGFTKAIDFTKKPRNLRKRSTIKKK